MIACAVRFMDDWVKRKLEPGDFEKILLVLTFETFQISSDFQANFGSWLSHLAMQLYQVPLLEMSKRQGIEFSDFQKPLVHFGSPADSIR